MVSSYRLQNTTQIVGYRCKEGTGMACANDQYFSDPKLRAEHERFARGFDPREGTFQGGSTFPQEDKVYRRDRLLFRFCHGGKSDEENLSSPWWLREASFNEIMARARMSEMNLIEMSRIKNAPAGNPQDHTRVLQPFKNGSNSSLKFS